MRYRIELDVELPDRPLSVTPVSVRPLADGYRLTKRETEVLEGLRSFLSNKEIANNLHLSERTIKFHVSSLLLKFKVRSRNQIFQLVEAPSQCTLTRQ